MWLCESVLYEEEVHEGGGVAQTFFKGILCAKWSEQNGISWNSNGQLGRALEAQTTSGGVPHTDQRGRHEPPNKTPPEKLELVKEHIESFLAYKSHYSRKDNPNQKYLSPSLSISKMYQLFKDFCSDRRSEPVSECKHR